MHAEVFVTALMPVSGWASVAAALRQSQPAALQSSPAFELPATPVV